MRCRWIRQPLALLVSVKFPNGIVNCWFQSIYLCLTRSEDASAQSFPEERVTDSRTGNVSENRPSPTLRCAKNGAPRN